MKLDELRKMSITELNNELINLRRELFNMRMQIGTGQSVRPHLIKNAKLGVAQIKTILREKEIGGAKDE